MESTYKHINEFIKPSDKKNWLVQYIKNSVKINFLSEMEERFNELKPEFTLRLSDDVLSIEEASEVISEFSRDFNSWINEEIKKTLPEEEKTNGNIFVIFGINLSEDDFRVVKIELVN